MNQEMNRTAGVPALMLIGAILAVGISADGPEEERRNGPAAREKGPESSLPERPTGLPSRPMRPLPAIGVGPDRIRQAPSEKQGRETGERFPVPDVMMAQEHWIWLAVREGVLEEGESVGLLEGLRTVLADRGIKGDPDPARMWKELVDDAEIRPALSTVPGISRMEAMGDLEAARGKRFSTAAASLVLAWIDELLLVPEADRQAWIRDLEHWERVKGFTPALEKGRKVFLYRLPSLSLPSVDPSLLRTEAQGRLWRLLLTGKHGDEEVDPDNEFAGLQLHELARARRDLTQDRVQGRIGMEEFLRRMGLISRVEWNRRDRGLGRRRFGEEEEILRRLALMLFERQAESLGQLPGKDLRRHFSGSRGTIELWMEGEREYLRGRNRRLWHGGEIRLDAVGIWDVDMQSLTGHPVYQKVLREILPLDTYVRWRQERERRRTVRREALKEYAVARVDLRLKLSPAQRERARTAILAYDLGEVMLLERLYREAPELERRWDYKRDRSQREQYLIPSLCQRMIRDLDTGFMTPWQRQEAEEMQKEEE